MENKNKLQYFKMHDLHVVKRSGMGERFLYFDCETKKEVINGIPVEVFYIGWTCLREKFCKRWGDITEWRFWRDEEKLNRYIEKVALVKKPLTLYGHNIFFDLQACGFFDYFTRWLWQLDFVYDKGLTYILRIKKNKRALLILSTTNYFPYSLKELGKLVKLKKIEVDFNKVSYSDLKIYCKRDVKIMIKAMQYYFDFLVKHRLGYLGMTKSSQAFIAYRHRFMYNKILIHSDSIVTDLERKAYIGGRVECFRIGHQKGGSFITLDFNSNYAYVMANNLYPWRLVEYNVHMNLNSYHDILKTFSIVAHIEIETPENAFAVHYKGKVVFPTGRFECYVCSTGFKYALENNYIKRIINIAVYNQADLFSKYVNYFYALKLKYKKADNDIMIQFCKDMLTSLYGKFGQKGIVRKEFDKFTGRVYFKERIWDTVTQQYIIVLQLMNKLIYQYQEDESDNSFPALAAHITENARFLLWNVIKGFGKDKVLYCDTDSIMIRKADLSYVNWPISEKDLGALKIQYESKKLYIGGCKNYRTEDYRKIKGIPKNAIEVEPGVFEYETFGRQSAHMLKGIVKGVITGKTTRRLKAEYNKGIVHKDGSVTPFRF